MIIWEDIYEHLLVERIITWFGWKKTVLVIYYDEVKLSPSFWNDNFTIYNFLRKPTDVNAVMKTMPTYRVFEGDRETGVR